MFVYKIRNFIIRLGYHTKPQFIIVGAQKAGTTALFAILNQHLQLTGSYKKEIHFFDNDDEYSINNYWKYHKSFPLPHKLRKGNLLFEATPSYIYHPEVAKRLFKYNPDMKIIISLRNPVYRALSAWTMFHHYAPNHKKYFFLFDNRSFKEAIESELTKIDEVNWFNDKMSYVKRGIYYPQIKKYFEIFPKENILILEHNELKNDHENAIEKITSFLGIQHQSLKQLELLKSEINNENLYDEELELLNKFYKPHNEQLYKLIGVNYNW